MKSSNGPKGQSPLAVLLDVASRRLSRTNASQADAHSTDFLTQKLSKKPVFKWAARKPDVNDLAEAREVSASVSRAHDARDKIERLVELSLSSPGDERFQVLVARTLDRIGDPRAHIVWKGIDLRFPESRYAHLRLMRWAARHHGVAAARKLHEAKFVEEPSNPIALFVFGRSLLELNEVALANAAFERLEGMSDAVVPLLLDLVKVYTAQGRYHRARDVVRLAETRPGPKNNIATVQAQVDDDILRAQSILGGSLTGRNVNKDILKAAFQVATSTRDSGRRLVQSPSLGSTVLIGSNLCSGGAERQFVYTAEGLHQALVSDQPIGECTVAGPITVFCRSLSKVGYDFYAPALTKRGMQVHEFSRFPLNGGNASNSLVRRISDHVNFLPKPMQEGVLRLTDMLRSIAPEVVHIWQDGNITATGLAALLAGVPRIVLGVRSVPAGDRFELGQVERETIYRSLLEAGGVSLVANSRATAQLHENWLDMAPGSIAVIPNGVKPLDSSADTETISIAERFRRRTKGARLTVGSVMRQALPKRPFLWLDAAAAILVREPSARFILVGDGPLRQQSMAYAEVLGIASRVLFVGRTDRIGFWLSQMDVFLLLSLYEGLPNVLIEAQFAGLPVVTSPAGGAGETLIDGVTGSVLKTLETIDVADVVRAVLSWHRDPAEKRRISALAIAWAQANFSLESMLARTMSTYKGSTMIGSNNLSWSHPPR